MTEGGDLFGGLKIESCVGTHHTGLANTRCYAVGSTEAVRGSVKDTPNTRGIHVTVSVAPSCISSYEHRIAIRVGLDMAVV